MAGEHIELRSNVYYVAGTRVSLDSIVYSFLEGASPESIHEDFPALTLADVYGAISFYLDHRSKIDDYLLRRKAEWKQLEAQCTPPSADLQTRIDQAIAQRTLRRL